MDEQINQEQLKELLHYDPETGVFKWKDTFGWKAKQGTIAGGINGSGYIYIRLKRKKYRAHRLAWLYTYDNRLVNLRAVSGKENSRNQFIPTNNTSGHIGVSWHTKNNRWRVSVSKVYYGSFECKSDAIAKAKKVYKELGYHENHGKRITANG